DDLIRNLRRAVALRLLDVDADGLPIDAGRSRFGARAEYGERPRPLGAVEGVGDLPEPDHLPVPLGNDDLREFLRTLETPAEPDRPFVQVASDATDGSGEVLQLERLYHLRGADPRSLQGRRFDLHSELALDFARHFDFGDARDRPELPR